VRSPDSLIGVYADDREVSRFDGTQPLRMALDELLFHVGILDGLDRPAHVEHAVEFFSCLGQKVARELLDDM